MIIIEPWIVVRSKLRAHSHSSLTNCVMISPSSRPLVGHEESLPDTSHDSLFKNVCERHKMTDKTKSMQWSQYERWENHSNANEFTRDDIFQKD